MTLVKSIYQLDVRAKGCRVGLRANGYPVATLRADNQVSESRPLNPFLIGDGNELEVVVRPAPLAGGGQAEAADVHVFAEVRRHEVGATVLPGAGETMARVMIDEQRRARLVAGEEEFPVRLTARFDNLGPSFRERLVGAEAWHDAEAVKDYAMHLRELFVAGDANGLVKEMAPKLRDMQQAMHLRGDIQQQYAEVLQRRVLALEPDMDFVRSDLEAAACCGGRLWKITRSGGAPFFLTHADADGGHVELDVFVAPCGDSLRVVR